MNKYVFSVMFFAMLLFSNIFAQLDPTFGTNGIVTKDISVNDLPLKTFILPDGKILILHQGDSSIPSDEYHLVRFNVNGTIDATYGTNGVIQVSLPFNNNFTRRITGSAIQPDGAVILIGYDTVINGYYDAFITRINVNGTIDSGFGTDGVIRPNFSDRGGIASSIVRQSNGKLLVLGLAEYSGNIFKNYIIRYNPNGSVDTTFGVNGTGFVFLNPANLFVLNMQSNGSFVVSGSEYESPNTIYHYNADGTFDNTFQIYLPGSSIWKITIAPDDKIIAVAKESRIDALLRSSDDIVVRRYNPNGGLDTTFGTNGIVTVDVTSFQDDRLPIPLVQPDGKIVIAANTGIKPNRSNLKGNYLSLVRLNQNGSVDGKTILVADGNYVDSAQGYNYGIVSMYSNGNIVYVSTVYNSSGSDLLITRSTGIPLSNYRLHGIPFNFDSTSNAVVSIFRPSNSLWYLGYAGGAEPFGFSTDIPVSSDFVSSFQSDKAVFRPSNGTWYIATGFGPAASSFFSIPWGSSGDIPAPADFDGDGKSDVTLFRPSNGVWYIRNSIDNSPRFFQWGTNGDKPVTGDYDGDGFADIAVWRPSTGIWYIFQSSNNQPKFAAFGLAGDIPIQEDYDGDGKTDIGVWRPSTGIWYIIKSSDSNYIISAFGLPTDIPIPADYDGDRKTDIGVWRASQNRWYILNSANSSLSVVPYGLPTDIPLPARY
jgi:uncharacterized delta-60 repeat protein